jgi:ubiquinone/menaquinone biosynthesis C-methylase UbiE/uncharacterized protein YbaR (Trm112 family)
MVRLGSVTAAEERAFEKNHISSQKERYLSCDVMHKVKVDRGYAEKVRRMQKALGDETGWILDIGANTCGESEYLTTQGYAIVATDINEVALGISKERCERFGRKPPYYLACDAHRLALAPESVHFVVLNEVLHHMYDPSQVLREVARVLVPGGSVFLYEPYAFNPYRRLSEIRDRFKGTIERSFGVRKLKTLLGRAGLKTVSIQRHIGPPSDWKAEVLGNIHRYLRRMYYTVSKAMPYVFANLLVLATKPGAPLSPRQPTEFQLILRCPVSGAQVVEVNHGSGFLSMGKDFRGLYPAYGGIPVLIEQEARRLDESAWRALAYKASHVSGATAR